MDQDKYQLLRDINRSIIKLRGVYSAWSKKHGISYNEMLVLYTIRDSGFCTQKQICDSYLLPRQPMNHVISDMRRRGLLTISEEHCGGREKAFVLTEEGKSYARPLLDSLTEIELEAIGRIGRENLCVVAEAVLSFGTAIQTAIEENA